MRKLSTLAAALALWATPAAGQGVEIEAPGPSGPLKGSWLQAAQPTAPVVLIIPGSGPTDRDGNSPAGIKAAPYRMLAEALAAKGVSSARVDKRGMFGSAAAGDPNAASVRGYTDDIRSWVRTLRQRSGARCIWVLGHSEGALMALATAASSDEGICGTILVSGTGRKLGDVLREQLRASPPFAPHLDKALPALERLEAGQRVDTTGMEPLLLSLFAPQVQDYLIDLLAQDPAALAARVRVPMLVVQGQRDLQTTEADARRIASANPAARLVLLPNVNHVLKVVESDTREANAATYGNSTLPIALAVVEAVAGFVQGAGNNGR
jgi:pimeloyl-ACP methyl ester carboxylesterase